MTALATADELEARLGHEITDHDRAEALLDDASGRVRSYTGQEFDLVTETVRLAVRRGRVRLPQRPVLDVTAIADPDGNELSFTWHAGDLIDLFATPLNVWEIEPRHSALEWVDVTYQHGYAEIPDDVVGVVCQIAGRAYGTPVDQTGTRSESIDDYSYTTGGAAAAGGFGMLPDERETLDHYRRVGTFANTAR